MKTKKLDKKLLLNKKTVANLFAQEMMGAHGGATGASCGTSCDYSVCPLICSSGPNPSCDRPNCPCPITYDPKLCE